MHDHFHDWELLDRKRAAGLWFSLQLLARRRRPLTITELEERAAAAPEHAWHGGTITRRVAGLMERVNVVPVAIHPDDAKVAGIEDGDAVMVLSRRGRLSGEATLTGGVQRGNLFVPFVKLEESAANFLTNNAYDPTSRIPEYKVCAVRIEKKRPKRRMEDVARIGVEGAS